jgi:hypothetical protein
MRKEKRKQWSEGGNQEQQTAGFSLL